MIQNNKVANRYAKAFFIQTKENHELEKTLKDCQLILKTLVQEKEMLGILKNPTVGKVSKISVLTKIFKSHLQVLTLNFLRLVINRGREGLLQFILEEFVRLYNLEKNIIVVELSTTTPLSHELKESIKKKVSLTADVRLVEKIDKSLIGGFIINRGDKQYDASIRKKIRNTKRVFKV